MSSLRIWHHWAYSVSSSWERVKHTEFIKSSGTRSCQGNCCETWMFARNGCLDNFFDCCIQQIFSITCSAIQQRVSPAEPYPSHKYFSLHLRCLRSPSDHIRKEPSDLVKRNASLNVNIIAVFKTPRSFKTAFQLKVSKLYSTVTTFFAGLRTFAVSPASGKRNII